MIDLPDEAHVIGFWFVEVEGIVDSRGSDWMAIAYRITSSEPSALLTYRHRYYTTTDKTALDLDADSDQHDDKHWYRFSLENKTDDECIEIVDRIVKETFVDQGFLGTKLPWKVRDKIWRRIVKGSQEAFFNMIMTLPFVHFRRASPEEKTTINAARDNAQKRRN